ncbi:uncharacterized protein LOC133353234 [Lethenteron reissneri]|uniref:uncharacterized protein LOC133353234 n=1 Tax=Lethenteron reissneri TaxID=7753 RepID=UPI002AB73FB6|nr:uncharacterized protein LOC133353234 [Lethenteron reissneri]
MPPYIAGTHSALCVTHPSNCPARLMPSRSVRLHLAQQRCIRTAASRPTRPPRPIRATFSVWTRSPSSCWCSQSRWRSALSSAPPRASSRRPAAAPHRRGGGVAGDTRRRRMFPGVVAGGTFRPRGPSSASVALLRQSSVSSGGYGKHCGMALSIPLPRLHSTDAPGSCSPHAFARAAAAATTTTFQPRAQAKAAAAAAAPATPPAPCALPAGSSAAPLRARSTGPSVARLCGRTFYEPSHEVAQVQRSEVLKPTPRDFATVVQAAAARPLEPVANRDAGSERSDAACQGDQGSSTETLPADYCMRPQEMGIITTAERGGGGRGETLQNIRSELATRDYGNKPDFIRTL